MSVVSNTVLAAHYSGKVGPHRSAIRLLSVVPFMERLGCKKVLPLHNTPSQMYDAAVSIVVPVFGRLFHMWSSKYISKFQFVFWK